jgi:hypothetical protein
MGWRPGRGTRHPDTPQPTWPQGNREWELRNRLARAASRMHTDHLDLMVEDLRALPKQIGEPILAAWNVEEDLRDLLNLHGTNPTRHKSCGVGALGGGRDPEHFGEVFCVGSGQ